MGVPDGELEDSDADSPVGGDDAGDESADAEKRAHAGEEGVEEMAGKEPDEGEWATADPVVKPTEGKAALGVRGRDRSPAGS